MAMDELKVPSWLTDEFLENALRNEDGKSSLQLLKKEVIADTSIGDHYASSMYRVKATTKCNGYVKDIKLIIKAIPEGELAKMMSESNAFQIETKMFAKILPAMRKLVDEDTGMKKFSFGAKYFKCVVGDGDIIVVEDLTSHGYKMAQRHVGLDLEHCLLVMRTLARFHAASLVLMDVEKKMIDSMPEHIMLGETVSKSLENFSKQTFENLSVICKSWSNGKIYAERFLKRTESFMTDYQKMLRLDSDGFNVIIHGDMWVNNMLFHYDDSGKPDDVKFVDYQLSCVNSAAIDLQYFIYTSPVDEVRKNNIDDLLRAYHTELCETLEQLNYQHKSITYEKLMEVYEKKSLNGMYAAIVVFPIVAAKVEDAMDMAASFGEAGVDVTGFNRLNNPKVSRVLERLTPIFAEKGLL